MGFGSGTGLLTLSGIIIIACQILGIFNGDAFDGRYAVREELISTESLKRSE